VNETGGYKYRQKRSIAVYSLIAALLVLLISIFGVGVLFRVTSIIVEGESRYGAGEIIEASGISMGDSLSLSDKGAAAIRIRENLPYIFEVKIATKIPGTITIDVRESKPIASITAGDEVLIIDKECRLLEITDTSVNNRLINVTGFYPGNNDRKVGKKLIAPAGQETTLDYLAEILSAIINNKIESMTDMLEMSNIGNITFKYQKRFTVELGSAVGASQKISTMLSNIDKTEPEAEYIVSVKDPSKMRLIKMS
jgi:cell division protein FtsQ